MYGYLLVYVEIKTIGESPTYLGIGVGLYRIEIPIEGSGDFNPM